MLYYVDVRYVRVVVSCVRGGASCSHFCVSVLVGSVGDSSQAWVKGCQGACVSSSKRGCTMFAPYGCGWKRPAIICSRCLVARFGAVTWCNTALRRCVKIHCKIATTPACLSECLGGMDGPWPVVTPFVYFRAESVVSYGRGVCSLRPFAC